MHTLLILTIGCALIFDLVNGFHDAANSIATIVSTRVLRPIHAVLWAAFFNLSAMLLFAPRVADTLSKIVTIHSHDNAYIFIAFSGLVGATIWNILTWKYGLPTSSSHALIGGISGAALVYAGCDALRWDILFNVAIFTIAAPCIGFVLGACIMLSLIWACKDKHPLSVDAWFRRGQLLSAALYSIGHGANDAQKTMGIITALLISSHMLSPDISLSLLDSNTSWIILSCQCAMALGTVCGGWRIVKTMGLKMTKLKPIGGFAAETAGALTLFFATAFGIPVSTTHTINGAIIGTGSCTYKVSSVRWGVANNIVLAWIITIPASGSIAAIVYTLTTCYQFRLL